MNLYKKICKNPMCEKEFMGTRTQQYCCPECRMSTIIKENKKPAIVTRKNYTLDEIANEASEKGMTYGKYVAMQFLAERKKK